MSALIPKISEKTKTLIDETIVVDMVVPKIPVHWFNAAAETDGFPEFINEYVSAGVTWASLTVSLDGVNSIETTVKVLAAVRNYILKRRDKFVFVNDVSDILHAKKAGKLGLNFNFQGTNSLLGDLDLVETYRRLGVGHMLMAYNQNNFVAGGCHEKTSAGLSRFGERLIQEMNRVGMIVDGTHTDYHSTMEMCEVSSAPVIFSHSNVRELVDHERNISNEQIKACAKTNGVVGIAGLGIFLSDDREDVSAEAITRHIDYVAELVGPAHVGLGLDYVGTFSKAQGEANMALYRANPEIYPPSQRYGEGPLRFARPAVIPEVAERLLKKNYSTTDVRGILGENILRVCREVWK